MTNFCRVIIVLSALLSIISSAPGISHLRSSLDRADRRSRRNEKLLAEQRLEIEGRQNQEEMFGDVLENVFETIRETTRRVTNVGRDVLTSLGVNTNNEGIGGALAGTFNLVSIGADIITGVASHILGGGDLFSGLIPVIG